MENRLKHAASPYLLSHTQNPIHWHEWGEAAFAEARERDVPIFLSVGYATCHWCHVMNRESFMDKGVAEVLNRHFVAIKLDREERPDIDHLYMEACTALTGQGGWPLTVFLSHDKSPFFAGTYFPRVRLLELLVRVQLMWRENRKGLTNAGEELLAFLSRPVPGQDVRRHSCMEAGAEALEGMFDPAYGGFLPAPKFPALQRLLFLLRYAQVSDNRDKALNMVEKTLTGMAQGGLYDHLGGGFFRYSTDGRWHIPHYEKMLYDNAMAILTYAEGAVALEEPRFAAIARSCFYFAERELKAKSGGYYTALDAENEGGEGAFYLWTRSQVEAALGQERSENFCEAYGIGDTLSLPNHIDKGMNAEFEEECRLLYTHRQKRDLPGRDEKILTSSNALLAAALAVAGKLLGEEGWIQKAEDLCDFLLENMVKEGRLYASRYGTRTHQKAVLDDYAYLVWALIELHQATHKPKWLNLALGWNSHLMELFGGAGGGFFLSGRDVTDLPLRQKVYLDGPVPAGNAIACANLLRLHALVKDESFLQGAEEILSGASGSISRYPASATGLLGAILLLGNTATMTISPGQNQEGFLEAIGGYRPFLQVAVTGGEEERSFGELAAVPIDGKAAAYYCDRMGCHRPITNPEVLRELLEQR